MMIDKLNWDKVNNLIPVIVQDAVTMQVLMHGYMNQQALTQTLATKKVTFYSRTKQRLWTKGETSGNKLELVSINADCDNDSLLVLVNPKGPTCHLNNTSCFNSEYTCYLSVLIKLEETINQRFHDRPKNSYVAKLFNSGTQRIAQKVGEEGVEVALASVTGSTSDIINEVSDLLFHVMILLKQQGITLENIMQRLTDRNAG